MAAFIAALPAPTRRVTNDIVLAKEISIGENRFQAIGCAVCHVPKLGHVDGIFSDLLLHDMGPNLLDLTSAPPYRHASQLELTPSGSPIPMNDVARAKVPKAESGPKRQVSTRGSYGGEVATVSSGASAQGANATGGGGGAKSGAQGNALDLQELHFEAPMHPPRTMTDALDDSFVSLHTDRTDGAANAIVSTAKVRSKVIPTNFNQEWRTPPLWGLHDSAPYLHDGRAETVLEAIAMHAGEAENTRSRFFSLPYEEQVAVLAFLDTLIAPQSGVIPVPQDFTRYRLKKQAYQ